jgi:DNA invertase Pin-like site-specific DNA recombinase
MKSGLISTGCGVGRAGSSQASGRDVLPILKDRRQARGERHQLLHLDAHIDTTTPMGKLVFQLTGAFAEFERTMIRQRIKAGLKRAVAQGVKLGRPKIDSATERKVRRLLAKGVGILKVARSLGIGTGTVQRISGERAMSLRGAEQ